MKSRDSAAILIGALLATLALIWWFRPSEHPPVTVGGKLPGPCRDLNFEAIPYIVCEIDLRSYEVAVFHAGADGKVFGWLDKFDRAMSGEGRPVLLAMNAGMYHEDLTPVGLLVENGREIAPLNLADGKGNFFLKPNGVFLVRKDGKAAIMETNAYAAAKPDVAFANLARCWRSTAGFILASRRTARRVTSAMASACVTKTRSSWRSHARKSVSAALHACSVMRCIAPTHFSSTAWFRRCRMARV